jgi:hypothetical protein
VGCWSLTYLCASAQGLLIRIILVATVEWGLITGNQTSFKSAADLIAAAKAAPGKIDYSSGGPGGPQHLAMAMFCFSRRYFAHPCALQGRDAGGDRCCCRTDSGRLSGSGDGRRACARRSAKVDRCGH